MVTAVSSNNHGDTAVSSNNHGDTVVSSNNYGDTAVSNNFLKEQQNEHADILSTDAHLCEN